jgi:rfaE bifunctional protein kinase chain/domain/rfaE bifunctional protein nucleotidyltransferase chain/domain
MIDPVNKIKDLSELSNICEQLRKSGKEIVLCHGVFDLLHIGHIKYFQRAKNLGDCLIVTLTADAHVNKGPNRPAFSQKHRLEAIAALECVDYVAINDSQSAINAIEKIKPNKYVKGKDYKDRPRVRGGNLSKEEAAVKAVGGQLVFTDEELFSSSSLINTYFNTLPDEVNKYLQSVRSKFLLEEIESVLDSISNLNVLVVGETIIDEYYYCEAIGKSGKEPVLVTREKSSEKFAGGSLAVANNVAGFCNKVSLLSHVGTINPEEDFIRKSLRENVTPILLKLENRPTITKRRYVDSYLMQKMFEIYKFEDEPLLATEEAALQKTLLEILPQYDLVIVADYGHGMLSTNARSILCDKSKFLAVNTQANAGNNGFHTISVYPRADYISISYGELCLDMRKRHGEVQEMIDTLRTRVECDQITVTRGKNGIFCWNKKFEMSHAPAMTQHFVDRVGSGDAVLSVTSPLAAVGADPFLMAFLGNLAGAEAVKTVGHRSFMTRSGIMKQVQSLLK